MSDTRIGHSEPEGVVGMRVWWLVRFAATAFLLATACAAGDESDSSSGPDTDPEAQTREEAGTESPSEEDVEPESAAAAVGVIRNYYDALGRGDFATAYGHWAEAGRASGQTLEEFRRTHAAVMAAEVDIGEPGRIDPAAGSRYIRIPVEIRLAVAQDAGTCSYVVYTLRRSVVTGATAAQRRWQIQSVQVETCGPANTREA